MNKIMNEKILNGEFDSKDYYEDRIICHGPSKNYPPLKKMSI